MLSNSLVLTKRPGEFQNGSRGSPQAQSMLGTPQPGASKYVLGVSCTSNPGGPHQLVVTVTWCLGGFFSFFLGWLAAHIGALLHIRKQVFDMIITP